MNVNNIIQCPYCQRWIKPSKGGFKHPVRTCRKKENTTSTNHLPSTNPLLSLVGQTQNVEYDCDYVDEVDEDIICDSTDYVDEVDEVDEDIICDSTHFCTNDEGKLEDNSMYNKSEKKYSSMTKFQVGLSDIVNKHKASLQMYDDVCNLVNEYTSSPYFDRYAKLQSRKYFLKHIEESHGTHWMRPIHRTVRLHDNTNATVPVFDTKAMLINILTDSSIMIQSNFAEGYNVLTGEVDMNNPCNHKYGEVHTGDAWMPTKERYCDAQNGNIMPVGLIIFGDKSHTDLHGALSLTPIIFTLTLFNRSARNNTKVWRPMGYVPNLSYGKGTANRSLTRDKIQDEHSCLSCILSLFEKLHKKVAFI
jgi:hypothetical protein